MLSNVMAGLEGSIVATALPAMMAELHGIKLMSWVVTIYMLLMAVSSPIWTKLAERFGYKQMFVLGTLLFTIGSLGEGLAINMLMVIVARALMGLGAGVMIQLPFVIYGMMYQADERRRVIGNTVAAYSFSTIAGPIVGGLIVTLLDWRWVFFINITCGILLLAVLSPMAQDVIGMSAQEAAAFVGIIGIMNGGGRILWSTISDRLSRPVTYILFFALEILAFFALSATTSSFVFKGLVLFIISAYGGGFSCMPAYLSDLFGTKQLSAIHGRILSAWAMAGIAGPTLISFFYKQTGTYASVLIFFAVLFIPNLIIAIQLKGKGFEQKEVPALDSLETK